MVNTRSKMQRTNSKVRLWLIANGYNDIYFFPHSRFSKDYHISHPPSKLKADFDGIATKENTVTFFQCKSNCRISKKTLMEYAAIESIFGIECLWFNAVDRKPLEVNNGMPISSE